MQSPGIPAELLQPPCPFVLEHTRARPVGEPGDLFPGRITAIKTHRAPVCHLLVCLIRWRNDQLFAVGLSICSGACLGAIAGRLCQAGQLGFF